MLEKIIRNEKRKFDNKIIRWTKPIKLDDGKNKELTEYGKKI